METRDLTLLSRRLQIDRVSVQIRTEGAAGSLIGSLSAVDRATGLVHDVPLKDLGPIRQSTGSYPWRLDGDYSTVVSITNIGKSPANLAASIRHARGVFWFNTEELGEGASAVFDLRMLRDGQTADRDGRPLPLDVERGQFSWSIVTKDPAARFIGRAEVISASAGVSSSYSCGQCCPYSYSYGYTQPVPIWTPEGWSTGFNVYGQLKDCYGGQGPNYYAYANSWSVYYPSVASVYTTGTGTASADGISGGQSGFAGYWTDVVYEPYIEDCIMTEVPAEAGGTVQTQRPSSLQTVSDTYIVQQFNNYNRERHYQVLDQDGQAMTQSGLPVTESYSAWNPNGCNFSPIATGSTTTNNQGRFKDNYLMNSAPMCISNPNCTSTATQTIRVSGNTVGTFTTTYGCNGVTITP